MTKKPPIAAMGNVPKRKNGNASRRDLLIGGTLTTAAFATASAGQGAALAPEPSGQMMVGLFTSIGDIELPNGVTLISTSGWSAPGIGMARYVTDPVVDVAYVRRHPTTAALSRNNRGFRLVEPMLSAHMTGARPGLADNGPALQHAIDEVSAIGGGQLTIPAGTYGFTTTLKMRSGVDLVGAGKSGTILRYDGAGVALDAVGTANARRIFHLRDLSLTGAKVGVASTGIQIAWNQRALPMMERVGISGFGRYGIEFAGNNWLLTFRDVEIHDCGRAVPGGCGIFRRPGGKDFDALADIKFFGLVVEACGHPQSQGGAVTFPCTAPFMTQGLWFHGCCIEGNFGGAEMAFERIDFLSIDQSYFEIASEKGIRKNGILIDECVASITSSRFATDELNKGSSAIQAQKNARITLVANKWDEDFGNADISIATGAQITREPNSDIRNPNIRVVVEPTEYIAR
jgi:hypothetical protein